MKMIIVFLLVTLVLLSCAEMKRIVEDSKEAVDCQLECSRQYSECRDRAGDNEAAIAACNDARDRCGEACE